MYASIYTQSSYLKIHISWNRNSWSEYALNKHGQCYIWYLAVVLLNQTLIIFSIPVTISVQPLANNLNSYQLKMTDLHSVPGDTA